MNISSKRDLARQLRLQQTIAEGKMWWLLRSKALDGFRFYRQFLVGPFIVDFCCRSHKLVVELDGSQHAENKEYDQERTVYLGHHGYKVVRFWNNEFLKNPNAAMHLILRLLASRPHPKYGRPLPKGRGSGLAFPLEGEGDRRHDNVGVRERLSGGRTDEG